MIACMVSLRFTQMVAINNDKIRCNQQVRWSTDTVDEIKYLVRDTDDKITSTRHLS